ncbi:Uncharacterised protein [Klebsiella pneumoniae]|nr:Uncharacterised protein [Klebsiella pneumoniae]
MLEKIFDNDEFKSHKKEPSIILIKTTNHL